MKKQASTRDILDLLFPAPSTVEMHLRRINCERDLLEKLLDLSNEYERRRTQDLRQSPQLQDV